MFIPRTGELAGDHRRFGVAANLCFAAVLVVLMGAPALLRAQSSPLSAPWTFIGPAPLIDFSSGNFGPIAGRVTSILISGSTVYAGTAEGGIWSSTDSGTTWSPLTDSQAVFAIGSLTVDPEAAAVFYAGTGEANVCTASQSGAGILKSTDGGSTWSPLPGSLFNGLSVSRVRVDPTNSSHLLAAAVSIPPGGPNAGLYQSTDGGTTWTRLLADQIWDFAWDSASGVILAAGSEVYRSTDNGATFTALSALPSGFGRAQFSLSPVTPGLVWALFTDSTGSAASLFFSTDDGATWSAVAASSLPAIFASGSGMCAMTVAADPTSSAGVWIGGDDLWKSTDSGATWTNVTLSSAGGSVHGGQHAIAFSGGALWIGNDGGVWRSLDAGGSFTDANNGLAIAAVERIAPAPGGYEAGLDGVGVALSGSGSTWQTAVGLAGATVASSSIPTTSLFALAPNAGQLYRSSGSASFVSLFNAGGPQSQSSAAARLAPVAVDPNNSSLVYVGTNSVWTSANGGASFTDSTASSIGDSVTALAVSPFSSSELLAGGAAGELLESSDGGSTWSSVASGLPTAPITGISAGSTSGVWIASLANASASGGRIYLTGNNGSTWTDITGDLPPLTVNRVQTDPTDALVFYAATSHGVWATINGGSHWQSLGTGLPNISVADLLLDATNRLLTAATTGRGVWTFALPAITQSLAVTGGDKQSGTPGSTLPVPLAVTVTDAFGNAVAGATVTWSDSSAGGTFSSSSSVSGANGQATVTYTLPSKIGTVTVTAAVTGSTASFTETAVAGTPAAIETVAGSSQSGPTNSVLPNPLVAEVLDGNGNPVAGVTVAFKAVTLGTVNPASAVTNSAGQASTSFTLPATPAVYSVTASVSGVSAVATFYETAVAAPDFSLSLLPATQSLPNNSTATLTLASTAIGGSTATINLTCTTPVVGCSISPSSIAPGASATVTVGTASLGSGANNLVVTGNDGIHSHTASATITVLIPDFSITVTPTSAAVTAGSNAATVASAISTDEFTGTIVFSCSGLPTGAACSFKNGSMLLTGDGRVDDDLTITTTAPTTALVQPLQGPPTPRLPAFLEFGALMALLAMLAAGFIGRPSRESARRAPCAQTAQVSERLPGRGRSHPRGRRRRIVIGFAAFAIYAAMTACGGSGSFPAQQQPTTGGTPAGTYAITVTGKTNTITHSATFNLTVN
jgi:photosystem II stability/assembly factor-like uncharacterized protein